MSSLLVGCGLPGGMMGSMMADLKGFQNAINAGQRARGKAELSLDSLMVMLFREVEYVWPRLGYPPLVTPFSQYVKNTALMNLMATLQGKERWSTIDKDTWNMILGKMGQLPGPLAPEIIQLAKDKGLEFYEGHPQDAFPNELPKFEQIMREEGWDEGQDREELFELAMHERQYRDYRSGLAKERFQAELEEKKAKAGAPIIIQRPVVEMPKVDVEALTEAHPGALPVQAIAKGQLVWQIDMDDASTAPAVGTAFKAGDAIAYIQTYYGLEPVVAATDCRLLAVCARQGAKLEKNEIFALVK
jgi:pyruvate carboxylase subunit B